MSDKESEINRPIFFYMFMAITIMVLGLGVLILNTQNKALEKKLLIVTESRDSLLPKEDEEKTEKQMELKDLYDGKVEKEKVVQKYTSNKGICFVSEDNKYDLSIDNSEFEEELKLQNIFIDKNVNKNSKNAVFLSCTSGIGIEKRLLEFSKKIRKSMFLSENYINIIYFGNNAKKGKLKIRVYKLP